MKTKNNTVSRPSESHSENSVNSEGGTEKIDIFEAELDLWDKSRLENNASSKHSAMSGERTNGPQFPKQRGGDKNRSIIHKHNKSSFKNKPNENSKFKTRDGNKKNKSIKHKENYGKNKNKSGAIRGEKIDNKKNTLDGSTFTKKKNISTVLPESKYDKKDNKKDNIEVNDKKAITSKNSTRIVEVKEGEVLHKKGQEKKTSALNDVFEKFREEAGINEDSKVLAIGSWDDYNPTIKGQKNILPMVDAMSIYQGNKYDSYNGTVDKFYFDEDQKEIYDVIYMINTIHCLTLKEMEYLLKLSTTKMFYAIQPNYKYSNLESKDFSCTTLDEGVKLTRFNLVEETVQWDNLVKIYTKEYTQEVCWTKIYSRGDYDIYVFMENHHDNKSFSTPKNCRVDINRFGGSVVYNYSTEGRPPIVVDKDLMTELKTLITGKDRTVPEVKTYIISEARKKMKEYNCLDEYTLPILVEMAYWDELEHEVKVATEGMKGGWSYYNKNLDMAQNFKNIRKLIPPFVFPKWTIMLLIVIALTLMNLGFLYLRLAYEYNNPFFIFHKEFFTVQVLGSAKLLTVFATFIPLLVSCWIILIIIIWLLMRYNLLRVFRSEHEPVQTWEEFRKENKRLDIAYSSKKVVELPLDISTSTLKETFNQGSELVVSDDMQKIKKLENQSKRYQYGPGVSFYAPSAHDSGHANSVISLNNRVVSENKYQPSIKAFIDFKEWVFQYGLQMLLPNMFDKAGVPIRVKPMDFNDWKSAFPKSRQTQLENAYQQRMALGNFKNLTYEVFIKIENLLKYEDFYNEFDISDPRNISSPDRVAIVRMAPWIKAFSNRVKQELNSQEHIFFPSGCDSIEIGSWFARQIDKRGGDVIQEIDFTRWDKTFNILAIDIELEIYGMFVPNSKKGFGILGDLSKQKGEVKLFNKFGDMVKVTGTRRSGDPNTSIGNTIINMLMHMYALYIRGFLPRIDYGMTALGDDNLVVCNSPQELELEEINLIEEKTNEVIVIEQQDYEIEYNNHKFKRGVQGRGYTMEDSKAVEKTMQSLGFDPKIKLRIKQMNKAEFCSGIFIPIQLDDEKAENIAGGLTNSYMLIPKPARWLAKVGWSVKKLHKGETPEMRMLALLKGQGHLEKIPYFEAYFKYTRKLINKNVVMEFSSNIKEELPENLMFHTKLEYNLVDEQVIEHCSLRYGIELQSMRESLDQMFSNMETLISGVQVNADFTTMAGVDILSKSEEDFEVIYQ